MFEELANVDFSNERAYGGLKNLTRQRRLFSTNQKDLRRLEGKNLGVLCGSVKSLYFVTTFVFLIRSMRCREFQKEETTEDNGTNFPSVDAVVIAVGQDEDVIYSKSTAIQVK